MKTCPECETVQNRENAREDTIVLCDDCAAKLKRRKGVMKLKRGKNYEYPLIPRTPLAKQKAAVARRKGLA
jgi:hypothetical protein